MSFKTVSRVINQEGGVSPKLVARVEQAVTDLGYRPDHRARILRSAASGPATIGFVMVDVANTFFSSLLRGIEEVALSRQCLVLAGSSEGDADREDDLLDAFIQRRVAGLIVVSGSSSATLRSELARGTPVVFVDLEPEFTDVDLVRSDHRLGAGTATRHLLDHGHTDIAYFGDDIGVYFSARLRLDGFGEAMAGAGLAVEPTRVVTGSHSQHEWAEIIERYFTRPDAPRPTAIFTAQNLATLGAVRALHRLGLRTTVAHVGYDDVDLADAVTPGVSVIPQDPRDLGRRAALQLFARIDGVGGPAVRQVIPSAVIARGSGEIRPGPGP